MFVVCRLLFVGVVLVVCVVRLFVCWLVVVVYHFAWFVVGCRVVRDMLVVGGCLLAVGCWWFVVGCWLFVVGCSLLVVGCWLLYIVALIVVCCMMLQCVES